MIFCQKYKTVISKIRSLMDFVSVCFRFPYSSSLYYHNEMTLKTSMTGLCDPLFNTLAADYFAVSILSILSSTLGPQTCPMQLRFFVLQDEPHYQYIPVSPQPFQIPPFSPCESLSSFFLEIPQDQPSPGVSHDVLYPLYSPHETPSPQPQTVATPPNDTVRNPVVFPLLNSWF